MTASPAPRLTRPVSPLRKRLSVVHVGRRLRYTHSLASVFWTNQRQYRRALMIRRSPLVIFGPAFPSTNGIPPNDPSSTRARGDLAGIRGVAGVTSHRPTGPFGPCARLKTSIQRWHGAQRRVGVRITAARAHHDVVASGSSKLPRARSIRGSIGRRAPPCGYRHHDTIHRHPSPGSRPSPADPECTGTPSSASR